MSGLINDKVSKSLNDLVRLCFESNAKVDRIVNLLDCKFNMPKTSNLLHQKLAHAYPVIFADKLTDYGLLRNNDSNYGNIPVIDKNYETIIQMFEDILEIQMNIEEQVKNTIDISDEERDYSTRIFIENFYVDIVVKYTKQALILLKAIKDFDEKDILPLFDSNIENYMIIN